MAILGCVKFRLEAPSLKVSIQDILYIMHGYALLSRTPLMDPKIPSVMKSLDDARPCNIFLCMVVLHIQTLPASISSHVWKEQQFNKAVLHMSHQRKHHLSSQVRSNKSNQIEFLKKTTVVNLQW